MKITVYGTDAPCQSCLHAPSSKETMEWLAAALKRKFPNQPIEVRYVDLDEPQTEEDDYFTEKIKEDAYFYPLVVGSGQVLGEGNPKLKQIVQFIEESGLRNI